MAEMKVYQREHFERKVSDLLNPEIEKEEMLLSSTIADLTESAEKNLARKLGADVIIDNLEESKEKYLKAQNKARTFFRQAARKRVSYKKSLSYSFERGENEEISPKDCYNQIRKWAEKLAEKEAEKMPIGKRISYLKAVKTNAKDTIMEAHVGTELKDMLGGILAPLGLSWNRPLPALAPPSADRPED